MYAQTQNKEGPYLLKDLVRLDPSTVKLWNGEKWTQVLGWNESLRPERPLEIVLRSGERIGCTPDHKFPTQRGLVKAKDMLVGDVIDKCDLPEPESPDYPDHIPDVIGWFVGMYIAEGSMSGRTIQIACHKDEYTRYDRLFELAKWYGGYARWYELEGNAAAIHIDSDVMLAILNMYVSGRIAKDKRLSPRCWQRSNLFLKHLLNGYLIGDGHEDGDRWRLGFTRNYEWEQDLRTICARLGYQLRLKPAIAKYQNGEKKSFRGEIRFFRSDHGNTKEDTEVLEIRNSRARKFYDVGVEDEPHLFALASGVLTHNSKPNPMPESVTDRPTKAHEYLFLLTKSSKYFYDNDAVREPHVDFERGAHGVRVGWDDSERVEAGNRRGTALNIDRDGNKRAYNPSGRNRRTVWHIATAPYSGAHFATYPPALVEPCIKAGTSERGVCPECGAPWERVTDSKPATSKECPKTQAAHEARGGIGIPVGTVGKSGSGRVEGYTTTLGWQPTCDHDHDPVPATIFDPFVGSGTTLQVARALGRHGVGLDLSLEYLHLARTRLSLDALDTWESGVGISDNGKDSAHKNKNVPGRVTHSFHASRKEKDVTDLPLFREGK